jgi:hypothetical protein
VGGKQNEPFQLSFNASLNVDCQGSRVTSDGSLILVLADLLRQPVYSRIAGYEGVDDMCNRV